MKSSLDSSTFNRQQWIWFHALRYFHERYHSKIHLNWCMELPNDSRIETSQITNSSGSEREELVPSSQQRTHLYAIEAFERNLLFDGVGERDSGEGDVKGRTLAALTQLQVLRKVWVPSDDSPRSLMHTFSLRQKPKNLDSSSNKNRGLPT